MMQKIKARIPKGFKLLIEESFRSATGDGIFVFEHIETKKKLYCKLCDLEDIRLGYVWEILTPEQLKELEIQESYNEEVHEGKTGYVVEESSPDDEQERIRKETEEFMRKQKEKNSQVVINLVGKGNEGEGDKSKQELEEENESLKAKMSIIAKNAFERKKKSLNAPDWITKPEELMDWEKNRGNIDPTSKPSSGTLSLQGQTNTGSGMEFEDQASMIEYLQRKIHSPKSSLEEKREAQAVKNELWRKMLAGKKGKAKDQGFDPIEDEGAPLFQKFYDEWRKREKGDQD